MAAHNGCGGRLPWPTRHPRNASALRRDLPGRGHCRAHRRLARHIARAGLDDLLVVAVLKGSFVFAADLIRALHRAGLSPEVDFITLSSYRAGTRSRGASRCCATSRPTCAAAMCCMVDDILESGRTLAFAKDLIARARRRARADLRAARQAGGAGSPIVADLRAFECPDVFVVGYGMDLAHRFRELPFVGRMVREVDGVAADRRMSA